MNGITINTAHKKNVTEAELNAIYGLYKLEIERHKKALIDKDKMTSEKALSAILAYECVLVILGVHLDEIMKLKRREYDRV